MLLFCVCVCVCLHCLSDGIRQLHRSYVSDSRQDFHKEVHHRKLHHRQREGQSRQLHHHARGYHRGGVRTHTSAHSHAHTCLLMCTLKRFCEHIHFSLMKSFTSEAYLLIKVLILASSVFDVQCETKLEVGKQRFQNKM